MTTMLKRAVGRRVRLLRKTRNLSQCALAEMIERTEETISNIERGLTAPSMETLARLSRALNVLVPDLLAGYDDSGGEEHFGLEMEIHSCLKRLTVDDLKIVKERVLAISNRHR